MALNQGELTRSVTIQQMASSVGPSKFPIETWSTLLSSVWASKDEQKAGEKFGDAQLSGSMVTTWTMRYIASMDPELVDVPKTRRVVYNGRVFDILSAVHVGRKESIQLTTLASSKVPS